MADDDLPTEKDVVPPRERPLVPTSPPIEELALAGGGATGTIGAIPGRTGVERTRTVVVYTLLLGIALLYFVPFLWMISTSLKTLPETAYFRLLPKHPTFHAFHEALTTFHFARYAANSAGLAATVTCLNVFLCSLGGYAFARLKFPGREVLFFAVLATLMVPDQLRLVPIFVKFTQWHLLGHYHGYVLLKLASAAQLFLMRQYFLTIPRDLEEAAKLDGAGYFKTFWKVMLPLAGPAIAAVAILEFEGAWNDFFWPLVVFATSPSHYTLPVGIFSFVTTYQTQWPQLMAGSVIAIAPIAVIYVFLQRFFVAGVASAGVKG
jgi:ABC-type glycerol-3-phosphate transport system permease component